MTTLLPGETNPAPVLETERLALCPLRVEDFQRYAEFHASPRSKFNGGPLSRENTWQKFAAKAGHWSLLGFGTWTIERREGRESVGQISLNFLESYPERELAWILWEEFEGHGYAYEAALRAREYAFKALGWPTVVSYVDAKNIRSIRLAERLGAVTDPDAASPFADPFRVYRHPK